MQRMINAGLRWFRYDLIRSSLSCLAVWTFLTPMALGDDLYYVSQKGRKARLTRSHNEFGVVFRRDADVAACARRLNVNQQGVVEDIPEAPDARVKLMRVPDARPVRRHALRQEPEIEEVRPVYRFEGVPEPIIATGQIVAKVRKDLTPAEVIQLWSDFDVEVVKPADGLPQVYLLKPVHAEHDEVLRAMLLADDSRIIWAHPNFRRPPKRRQIAVPGDAFFGQQWHLHNTGQSGGVPDADIDALEAWVMSEGQDILIGMADDAVDVDHEDLRANYLGEGHDPALESDQPGFDDPRPKQINDRHGTAVAGLAVARANSFGTRGVAYLAKFTASRGVGSIISEFDLASVFTFARQKEVDVHLNSWGIPGENSPVIEEAVRVAFNEGRTVQLEEGQDEVPLGMVIIWASGNFGLELGPNDDLSMIPLVIGVGASTISDSIASYSNYGTNITVLAPGGDFDGLLTTTDNEDQAGRVDNGYNVGGFQEDGTSFDPSGKYTSTFSGTSASCPIVAGTAALVLSRNPKLRASDVRLILEHTSDAIGPTDAQYHGVTRKSARYGYGRINAERAVVAADQSLVNGGLSWPGAPFNVRQTQGRLRWQTSVGTDEFLLVQGDASFVFAARDGECYHPDQTGCRTAPLVTLPAGVSVRTVIPCERDACDLGDDQSMEMSIADLQSHFGLFARSRIGRYSFGVAIGPDIDPNDPDENVIDPGPALVEPSEDGGSGDAGGVVEGPRVTINVFPLEGTSPLSVHFMGNAVSTRPIDEGLTAWDFDIADNLQVDSRARNTVHTYTVEAGESRTFTARLTMGDVDGNLGSATVMIRVTSPQPGPGSDIVGGGDLRIIVGIPGNPTADDAVGTSPFRVELSVDASSLLGTFQSISWDLGDGTTPRPTSLVVPHEYINTTNSDMIIPVTATVTTITTGGATLTMSATRLITIHPGTGSGGGGDEPCYFPPCPPTVAPTEGSGPCGALGFLPLLFTIFTLFSFRRLRFEPAERLAMLPKSNARVAEVIRIANEIAREYEQDYVGTEHVLLAIRREKDGIGARILAKHGLTEGKLRTEVDRLVKKRMEETWVFGRLPGTPHFRNVMAVAIQQCQQLDAKEVCTEHLLLALLQEKGSVAYKSLKILGLTYEQVRADVVTMLSEKAPNPAQS